MKKYSFYISLEGLNFDRLFNNLKNQKIKIYDYSRPNYKTCKFGLKFNDFYKIKKLKLFNGYKFSIIREYNLGFLVNNLIKNMGLYVGGLLSFIFIIIMSKTTLKINVLGIETIAEKEIISLLGSMGVSTGKINTASNETIEQYIKQNNEKVSLVSVIKKGTNLIVNIKEKISKDESEILPIYAPYNLVVKSISVTQGIACVEVGDVVKKGEILVDVKKILTNGVETLLKPIANIETTVWISGSINYKTEEIINKKTGKKVVWSYYDWNGSKLFSSTPQVKFENYEKSVYNDYVFKNMFLPIKINKTIFYELKQETIKRNFEDNREKLILQSKELARSKMPKGYDILNENTIISNAEKEVIITTYLQINYTIKG